jgi:hypothetical protein
VRVRCCGLRVHGPLRVAVATRSLTPLQTHHHAACLTSLSLHAAVCAGAGTDKRDQGAASRIEISTVRLDQAAGFLSFDERHSIVHSCWR